MQIGNNFSVQQNFGANAQRVVKSFSNLLDDMKIERNPASNAVKIAVTDKWAPSICFKKKEQKVFQEILIDSIKKLERKN